MYGFEDATNDKEHLVLTMGDVKGGEPVLAGHAGHRAHRSVRLPVRHRS